jgi:hypothetical protein
MANGIFRFSVLRPFQKNDMKKTRNKLITRTLNGKSSMLLCERSSVKCSPDNILAFY